MLLGCPLVRKLPTVLLLLEYSFQLFLVLEHGAVGNIGTVGYLELQLLACRACNDSNSYISWPLSSTISKVLCNLSFLILF